MGKCQCFLTRLLTSLLSTEAEERGKSIIYNFLSVLVVQKVVFGRKKYFLHLSFRGCFGGLCHVIVPVISTVFPLRDAHFTRRRRHIYIITKNDDDDADDVRDDDAVFVFVFWKKQQKEPFDDHHYGEER